MGVRDLFQFQRAFESDRVGRAVAETVHVIPLVDVFRNRFDLRTDHLNGLLHQFRDCQITRKFARRVLLCLCPHIQPHLIRQIQERHDLVGKCLRGGNADFVSAA